MVNGGFVGTDICDTGGKDSRGVFDFEKMCTIWDDGVEIFWMEDTGH